MSPFRLILPCLLLLLSACNAVSSPDPLATREQQLASITKVNWQFGDYPNLSGYVLVSLGSQAVLFGSGESMYLWDGARWTPQETQGWPSGRPLSTMIGYGPGLLMFGGYDSNTGARNSETWQWDGTRWTQLFPATTPPARSGHAMAVVGGKVVMFGGYGSGSNPLTDTWTWDGEDWTQVPTAHAPATNANSMVALGSSVLLLGTVAYAAQPPQTWIFDGVDWTRLSPVNQLSAQNNSVLATLGGTAYAYDGTDTWQWTGADWLKLSPATSMPTRYPGEMVSVGSTILHYGGSTGNSSLRDTWTFDGTTWTERWKRPVSMKGASMATLNGKAVLFRSSETWEWDGTSWTQRMPATVPPSRQYAAMATLGNKVVMYGGTANDTRTWLWDGTNWTALTTATNPGGRQFVSMAPLGGRLILFGGLNMSQVALSDTWQFDGVNWSQLSPTSRPGSRGGYGLATVGGKVLLYGGAYTDGANPANTYYYGDTWLFDGTNWSTRSGGPGTRYAPTLAELDGKAVLHGGRNSPASNGVFLSDTWIFDLATGWYQPQVTRRAPGIHEATASTLGHTVVMWGGGTVYWYGTSGTWTVSASLAAGVTCDSAVQCESGSCVDGVCCLTACSGTCESCNQPGSEGICTAVPAGEPRPGTCEVCNGDGGCDMPWPEDAGTPDAGTPDAGTPDAGTPDAGPRDAGMDGGTDAGTRPDAGSGSGGGGTGCATGVTGLNACLLAFAMTLGMRARRRRED